MYIKQISIEGFKSYSQRTVVEGFDKSFNAITGLNGTGKSNILDSICFVLGINNPTQLRATSLQELVYKSGQAGITKATVSITFDNSDKNQSPVGYEQYGELTVTRQVIIGGRNKFLINGVNAQNNRVADLFRSVQLNVNNPHFLIMQGRITKVLNMKPPEILSMIEEAAGTKMYESKKQSALRTIEKKGAKLQEIDEVLATEITPTLEKLKQDRTSYLEYQRLQTEVEQLNRFMIAYEYTQLKEGQTQLKDDLADIQGTKIEVENQLKEGKTKCEQIKNAIDQLEIQARKEDASRKSDSLETLETELSERQLAETKAATVLEHKQEELKTEEKKKEKLLKQLENDRKLIATKTKRLEDLVAAIAECEGQAKQDVQEFESAQRRIQALATGFAANDDGGADATLAAQLLTAKDELSRIEMDLKQADFKLKRLRPELKKSQANKGKAEAEYTEAKKTVEKGETEIARLEARVAESGYKEGEDENLRTERRQLVAEAERLQRELDAFDDSIPRMKFDYRNPTSNFDRSKVKGLVAKLISLKDANTATALEVAAGDRLYNVIVENEMVGKELLEKGQLKQRVTLIPLNKISAQPINSDIVRKAKRLVGDENCHLALTMIDYPPALQRAMEYVFGNTLVCTDMNAAKQVTFHPDIMKRTVTLRGEIFDPQGTLTGGSRNENATVLKRLTELKAMASKVDEKQRRMREIDESLGRMANSVNEWRTISERLRTLRQDVSVAKTKLESTSHHQQLEIIRGMEQEIDEAEKIIASSTEAKTKLERRIAELEDHIQNADQYQKKEMKQAEARLKEAEKRSEKSQALLKQKQEDIEPLKLEIQEVEAAMEGYNTELSEVTNKLEKIKAEITSLSTQLDEAREEVRLAQQRVTERKAEMQRHNKKIMDRQVELDNLMKENHKAELKLKQLDQDTEKAIADGKEGKKKLEHIAACHHWIKKDEGQFGQADGAYDFQANDPRKVAEELRNAQERKEKLHRTVNTRAMQMLAKAEQQYDDLIKKKEIVKGDKEKIEALISELDEKKREAIEKAWEQVNHDFGSIFSTLLPGARAKLEPPEGQSPLDGLEVRVGFGDIWKESLNELSGGQRSLVALSLILAMLLFKPAPIYILDEVDAALDISHTQNIGHMLKTHFKHSQFIVVSLKDGMFNNANVLFRTKFVDGCSTVTRQVQNQSR